MQAPVAGKSLEEEGFFHMPSIANNKGVLMHCRVSAAILSGCAVGLLGVTGLQGFIYYFIAHFVMSFLLLIKCNFQPVKYFRSWNNLLFEQMISQVTMMSYTLFWIIFYNLAHVF
eukprot:TRINITY_DN26810_c0_g1_i1.p3 TRINITY_DN26810_c0_g1~~TRINITY_DN26810_c0_g1_i1.p3  ORF type:complete len:115 (-),score=2.16 TRINITY_DN26810_c0_g1_i1:293-637(-)